MKKKIALITSLIVFVIFSETYAQDLVFLELGSASGETTWKDSGTYSGFSGDLDHKTSGGSFGAGYQHIRENDLLLEGGYQQLSVSGSSDFSKPLIFTNSYGVDVTTQMVLKTDSYTVSGFFGAVGYNVETMEKLLFQPNLRIGLANKAEAIFTGSVYGYGAGQSVTASQTYTQSQSGLILGFIFPLVYQFDDFSLGLKYAINGVKFSLISGTEEMTFDISSAFQLVFGFSL